MRNVEAATKRDDATMKFYLKNGAEHFATTTSIRGLPRILKSQDPVLKFLWAIFVVTSFCVLLYFIISLYIGFSKYTTAIQQVDIPAQNGDFPVISFCYDMPLFKDIPPHINPSWFRKRLDDAILKLAAAKMENSPLGFNLSVWQVQNADSVKYYVETYLNDLLLTRYKSFRPSRAVRCSFASNSVTKPCKITYFPSNDVHLNTRYFHCFKVTVPLDYALVDTSVAIYLDFKVAKTLWDARGEWFKADMTTHLYGFGETISVHLHSQDEPGQVERDGTKIHLDNIVQLDFQKVHYKNANTPKNPCRDTQENGEMYSTEKCFKYIMNKLSKKRCGCVVDKNSTSIDTPYCNNMTTFFDDLRGFSERIECLESIREEFLLKKDEQDQCPRTCTASLYDVHRIITMPYRHESAKQFENKLDRIEGVQAAFNQFQARRRSPRSVSSEGPSLDQLRQLLNCPTSDEECSKNNALTPRFGARVKPPSYDYVNKTLLLLLTRKAGGQDRDVIETLVITKARLLSQIGGMCSIFVGLTFTVIAEVVEMFYLACVGRFKQRRKEKKVEKSSNEQEQLSLN